MSDILDENSEASKGDCYTCDVLCLGTSSIMALEALYLAKSGKSVLMVDKDSNFGGAWKSIEIANIKHVENAIHYFLPNPLVLNYLQNKLSWPIEASQGKYRFINIFGTCYLKLPYASRFARFISKNIERHNCWFCLSAITSHWRELFNRAQPSKYLAFGSGPIIDELQKLLDHERVAIWLNSEILRINVDKENKHVICQIGNKKVLASELVLGHGARLPAISCKDCNIKLTEKFHPRPAFHLVIEDEHDSDTNEAIFVADNLIKYAHDVSRYTSLSSNERKFKKVLVFALQSNIPNHAELAELLHKKLKDIKMVGSQSTILASKYTPVILPTLSDDDLIEIEKHFFPIIRPIKTENFTAAVELRLKEWQTTI